MIQTVLVSVAWSRGWELRVPPVSGVQTREEGPLPWGGGGEEATPGMNTQEKVTLVPFLKEVPPGLIKNPGAQPSEGRFLGNPFFPSSLQKYKTQTMPFL